MNKPYVWKLALIILVVGGLLLAYLAIPMTLGIDLQGGSVLIYELDFRSVSAARARAELTDETIDILQRRLDSVGLKEMSMRRAGETQIVIQLPGVSPEEKDRIRRVIDQAGDLWFKIVAADQDADEIARLHALKEAGTYRIDEEEYDVGTQYGKKVRKAGGKIEKLEPKVRLLLNEDRVDGKLVETARFTRDESFQPAVAFDMRPSGRERLAATTTKWFERLRDQGGAFMAIVLDGEIISAPRLEEPLTGGSARIHGDFSEDEINELIMVLRSGALPAKPVLQSESTIGPALGEESIRRGMLSMYAAAAVVFIFMLVYYRGAGGIANIALAGNLVILLGIMALFEATLTLPGIAGVILSMGMSIDANVLIFERIREEKKRGVPIREAIAAGYDRAFWAIFDGNVTTILTSGILYYVGTGPIRGFALTLAIGITASMFTALFVTRALFDLLTDKGVVTEVKMLTLTEKTPSVPFLRMRMPFVIAGIVLLNAGFLYFSLRGPDKYGIDFNGGTVVQVNLWKPLAKSEIEARLAAVEAKDAAGATVHPYDGAEVQRIGESTDEATGAGLSWQILVSEASAPSRAAASPVAPAAAAAPAGAEGAAAAETEASLLPETPQAAFLREVSRLFADELVPPAFEDLNPDSKTSDVRVEPDPADPTKARITVVTNVVKEAVSEAARLKEALAGKGYGEATVETRPGAIEGQAQLAVATGAVDIEKTKAETHETRLKEIVQESLKKAVSTPFPLSESIGASVAKNLKSRGVLSIILSLIVMIAYIAFRFEFKAGIAASLCLFHDVLVTLGFMMVLDATSPWTGIDAKINLTTIAAFLTIVGYQINDTIVTFDRMRENLRARRHGEAYEALLNRSINETLGRTIIIATMVTLTLIVLALSGVRSIQGFTFAMILGTLAGTFSTIFIATPILLVRPRRLGMICLLEAAFLGFLPFRAALLDGSDWTFGTALGRIVILAFLAGAAYLGLTGKPGEKVEELRPAPAPPPQPPPPAATGPAPAPASAPASAPVAKGGAKASR